MIKNLFLAGLGGFVGSALRYSVGVVVSSAQIKTRWTVATILVNLVGCFVLGLIAGLAGNKFDLSASARVFIITGILGGFTTFSAFGIESITLLNDSHHTIFIGNVLVQVVGGILFCGLGMKLATLL